MGARTARLAVPALLCVELYGIDESNRLCNRPQSMRCIYVQRERTWGLCAVACFGSLP